LIIIRFDTIHYSLFVDCVFSLLFFGSPVKVSLRVVEAVAFESLRQRMFPVAEAFKRAVAEVLEATSLFVSAVEVSPAKH
jgi:hypothetical protein